MTQPIVAPVMDQTKLERQKELLLAYVQHHALLPPHTRYSYSSHEYQARKDEPMKVVLHLNIQRGAGESDDASFEFSLEELKVFQGRPLPSGTPSATPPAPKSATRTAPRTAAPSVDQISWENNREKLFANARSLEAEARRFISVEMNDGMRRMQCRCVSGSKSPLCEHLQFVYATNWEREKLLDEDNISSRMRSIRLPIGMGQVYVNLVAEIIEDSTRSLGQLRTGYVRIGEADDAGNPFLRRLAEQISPYPREIDHVILAPGEGTIKAIRYIENLLRGTEAHESLVALSPSGGSAAPQQANMICKRNHAGYSGQQLVAEFLAGLRAGNPHRENWMVACAYTIFMFGLCLPCHNATSAAANVPVF